MSCVATSVKENFCKSIFEFETKKNFLNVQHPRKIIKENVDILAD